ncbi:MAG: radical SAM protein [bacterium]
MTATTTDSRDRYYQTTTLCPHCERLLDGEVQADARGVFIRRTCPDHGLLEGLVCSDVAWWEGLGRFDVAPSRPAQSRTAGDRGCPDDCGLCPAHRQIAGTTAIEISNRCNAGCPVCIADNQETFELSVEEVVQIVDRAGSEQGGLDVVTLSGGEPTIHPHFFELLDALVDRPGVGRVVVNTNGIRIAAEESFADRLARYPVYVSLHYDGPAAAQLRGTGFDVQERALTRLCERGIDAVPLVLAVGGVNDVHLGELTVELLTRGPQIKSIILSLMAYAGHGGEQLPFDPMTRLTIPAALEHLEEGAGGAIRKGDFMPLTMPNPMCAAVGYFLVDENGALPLIRAAGLERAIEATKNAHFARADEQYEAFFRGTLERVYAHPELFDDGAAVLARLKRFVSRVFPADRPLSAQERARVTEESVKTVYLMQFMDGWTFDTRRLSKCSCQHLFADGHRIPSCGYYAYHRKRDPRFSAVNSR